MVVRTGLPEHRKAVGQRIREWRLRRDLSQAEVARVAGITQASLSNYETGKRDLPLSTLLGVSRALEVGVGDILDTGEVVIVRDTRLGRAVERLVKHPELAEIVAPNEMQLDGDVAAS